MLAPVASLATLDTVACIILILILYLISIIIIILMTSVNFEPLCDHNDCCATAAASSSV